MAARILVIEDDADTRDAYAGYLELAGYSVEAVSSGAEGIQAARGQRPDAILLDLTLPDGDGRRLREHLLDDPKTDSIPVVALTGHELTTAEKRLFSRVFLKPVDLDRLVAHLRELNRDHT